MTDALIPEPACWSWPITAADRSTARRCPEHFGYVALWNWQRAYCAICGVPVEDVDRLRRDHDHATGLARGLLCTSCNGLEGLAARLGAPGARTGDPHDSKGFRTYERWQERNADLINLMALYRAVNPASMIGLRTRHEEAIAPRGIVLPTRYAGELPIFDIDMPTWTAFYRATGSGGGADYRMERLAEFMRQYIGDGVRLRDPKSAA